jgi:hypothetical protein
MLATRRRSLLGLAAGTALSQLPSLAWAQASGTAKSKGGNKPAQTAKPADPLAGFYRDVDEMQGITWYLRRKVAPGNKFFLYFGKWEEDGRYGPLTLHTQYYSDSWLFVRWAWTKIDGEELRIPAGEWKRDHASGDVWEWSDAALTADKDKNTALRIAYSAKPVTVRFEGQQYYDDKKLSSKQLQDMREVIEAYEKVTGKPWGARPARPQV